MSSGPDEITLDHESDARLAPHRARFGAFVIDVGFVALIVALAVVMGQILDLEVSGQPGEGALLVVGLVAVFGCFGGLVTWLSGGQTVGKAAFGLTVRRPNCGSIAQQPKDLLRLIARQTVGYVVVDVFGLGCVLAGRAARRRCPHDIVFGTEVLTDPRIDLTRLERIQALHDDVQSGLELVGERWGRGPYLLAKWSSKVIVAISGAVVAFGLRTSMLSQQVPAASTATSAQAGAVASTSSQVAATAVGGVALTATISLGALAIVDDDSSGVLYPVDAGGGYALMVEGDLSGQRVLAVDLSDGSSRQLPREARYTSPVALRSQVDLNPETGQVVMSSRDNDSGIERIFLTSIDGNEGQWITEGPLDTEPVLSPDGETVAFSRNGTINLVDVDGGTPQPLLTEDSIESLRDQTMPVWSPDGDQLMFQRRSEADAGVWVADLQTGTAQRILESSGSFRPTTWSPDGSRIAVVGEDNPNTTNVDVRLFTVEPDGSNLTVIADENLLPLLWNSSHRPQWSPDGNSVAVAGARTGFGDLCVVSIEPSDLRCPMLPDSIRSVGPIFWSASDDVLVASVSPQCERNCGEVWTVSPDGTFLKRLASDG